MKKLSGIFRKKHGIIFALFLIFSFQFYNVHAEYIYIGADGKTYWGHVEEPSGGGEEQKPQKPEKPENKNDSSEEGENPDKGDNPDGDNTSKEKEEAERKQAQIQARVNKLEEIRKQFESTGLGSTTEYQSLLDDLNIENNKLNDIKEKIAELQEKEQQKNSSKKESQNSAEPGDPVKATEGSYEQSETDFTLGSSIELKVNRNYSSAESITSGFGYGWTTNLDQRIILGVEKNARQLYEAMLEYNQNLAESIENLKSLILRSYGITSPDTSQIDSAISRAEEIGRELEELGESGRAAGTISALESVKQSLERDLETLHGYENELEQKKYEAESYYKNVVIRSERNHAANCHVLFTGTPSYYEETGVNTITVADENGYPHMMKQTGEGEWKEENEKTYIKCVS
ncbi:MAG: DUF6531 domain-containing protein, partial [Spirochaetales bacterium]|nr:DUF6531 domain-containing protein [Spirochaetales bacterium]